MLDKAVVALKQNKEKALDMFDKRLCARADTDEIAILMNSPPSFANVPACCLV